MPELALNSDEQSQIRREAVAVALAVAIIAACYTLWLWRQDELLNYGDAMAHLNIARRLVDTRTPGMLQIGTVWLPLPHVLMAPFTAINWCWHTGLAGAAIGIPALALAAMALFLILRRYVSLAAALAGTAVLALNPNALYLAATPMTEVLSLCTILWAIYWATHSQPRPILCGLAATLACLTRYEAWFLLPFLALAIFYKCGWRKESLRSAILFSVIAALGPLWWLAHNWWFFGDALEFYHGEYSAKAIYQRALDLGAPRYPADGSLAFALQYYALATALVAAWSLIPAMIGWWLHRRQAWPLAMLLAAPAAFIIWSLRSAGTQIFVPALWPHNLFNLRYALIFLPWIAVGAGLLANRARWASIAVLAFAVPIWLQPNIVRAEGHLISTERRAWTESAASFLATNYRGGGIALSFGDPAGVLQQAIIPLRESLHDGDRLRWQAALNRPDLFLHEQWALCFKDDPLSLAVGRSHAYRMVRRFDKVELWVRLPSEPDPAVHP